MTSPPNNHNGGPPDRPLTPASKLECIRQILDRTDLTAAQKCVGAGIVVSADREWMSEVRTLDLQRFASVIDRETVFRATKVLDTKGIVSKAHSRGQAGKFHVLPPSIVSAIIDEYEELKSSRVKPDGTSGRQECRHPVGFDPTTSAKAVGLNPTTKPDVGYPRALVPACIETPSGLVITQELELVSEEKEETRVGNVLLLDAFNAYNDVALRVGLPTARTFTPDRRKKLAARLREHGGADAWQSILSNIQRSAFLQGENDRGWRPTGLDWFLLPANFTKVIEGAYGNGAHAKPHKESEAEKIARWTQEAEERMGR